MAGNGTIGLELLEDLPDLDAVVIPYGGGGLSPGSPARSSAQRPRMRFFAAEPETAAAAAAALRRRRAGRGRLRAVVRRRRRQPPLIADGVAAACAS